ncbi:MAG: hypothetical protein M3479_06780 [Actinomycetota bacterium]|nr:hypothetical protein [Actinomycetota bacterium]
MLHEQFADRVAGRLESTAERLEGDAVPVPGPMTRRRSAPGYCAWRPTWRCRRPPR